MDLKKSKLLCPIFILAVTVTPEVFGQVPRCTAGGASASSTYTDPTIVSGTTPIKAVHITELRAKLNAKRVACALAPTAWTESIVPNVSAIKKQHIDEIRTAVNTLITLDASARSVAAVLPNYADPNIVVGTTPIKGVHIQELRDAIGGIPCGPIAASSFAATETRNGPSITYSAALWNNYKAWLIAQFAAMGSDISTYDFSAMGTQFNSIGHHCVNIGDNDPGLSQTYNINGMNVVMNVRWTGLEYANNPPGVSKCEVVIDGGLTGTLNGFTCP